MLFATWGCCCGRLFCGHPKPSLGNANANDAGCIIADNIYIYIYIYIYVLHRHIYIHKYMCMYIHTHLLSNYMCTYLYAHAHTKYHITCVHVFYVYIRMSSYEDMAVLMLDTASACTIVFDLGGDGGELACKAARLAGRAECPVCVQGL